MDKLTLRFSFVLATVGILFSAVTAYAQSPTIALTPPSGLLRAGEELPILVQLTSFGTNMNAVDVTLHYQPDAVQVVRLEKSGSALTLWPEEPTVDASTGTIHFLGGRPGGFVALDATLITVVLMPKIGGSTDMTVDENTTTVYRNDGVATADHIAPTKVTLAVADQLLSTLVLTSLTHPTASSWSRTGDITVSWVPKEGALYSYSLDTNPSAVPDDVPDAPIGTVTYTQKSDGVWYFSLKEQPSGGSWSQPVTRRFLVDTLAPEAFTILHPQPSDVDGKNIILWNPTDTYAGVVRSTLSVNGQRIGEVTSPLLLKPEWKGTTLVITAYDAAGNSTAARFVYASERQTFTQAHRALAFGGSVLFAGLLVGVWFLLRKR